MVAGELMVVVEVLAAVVEVCHFFADVVAQDAVA
jgi:hypothetical protein